MIEFRRIDIIVKEKTQCGWCKQFHSLGITLSEANYFVSTPSIEKNMYDPADDSIDIIYKDGTIKNIAEASDMLNISLLSKKVKKYYLCYQRLHR